MSSISPTSSFTPKPFGEYILVDLLGSGGMAQVYLALSVNRPSPVALKVLHEKYSSRKEFVAGLISEAKLSILLQHPNIVRVEQVGVVGTEFFIEMEWVQGVSLDRLLKNTEGLSIDSIAYIGHLVAGSLYFAHTATDGYGRSLDVVHRDVTPGNILLSFDGDVKLTDFGIAGAQFGKVSYMPPESILGEASSHRSDLYSLGVVLFELLSKRRPFDATDELSLKVLILHQEVSFEEPVFAQYSRLRDVVERCLAKRPQDRPDSAADLQTIFAEFDLEDGKRRLCEIMVTAYSTERVSREKTLEAAAPLLRSAQEREVIDLSSLELENEPSVPLSSEKTEWVGSAAAAPTTVRLKPPKTFESEQIGKVQLIRKLVERPKSADLPISSSIATPSVPYQRRYRNPVNVTMMVTLAVLAAILGIGLWNSKSNEIIVIQEIEIVPSIESGRAPADPKTLARWTSARSQTTFILNPLQRFFEREFQRYRPQESLQLLLTIAQPKIDAPRVSWQGSLFNSALPFQELEAFHQSRTPQSPRAILFAHLYSKRIEDVAYYPLDQIGKRPERQGVLYIALTKGNEDETLVRLAHEIGHILGARDKYDERGLARYPEGYAEPNRQPLHPQKFGDLMSRGVPVSANDYKPFKTLDDVRIGERSAIEMRWIERKQ